MADAYSLPQIYEIAFGFRDVPAEVNFLRRAFAHYTGRACDSALELACGPGVHVREFARQGIRSAGLDSSREMVTYAREQIERERLDAEIFHGDMRSFRDGLTYDLAYILISSFAHLLTDRDILDHFACVAELLAPGGIYFVTMPDPRDFLLPDAPSEELAWTEERDGVTVTTNWGGDNQQYDPVTEIDSIVISYDLTAGGRADHFEFPMQLRRCSVQTFEALVALSRQFDIIDRLGDFDLATKFSETGAGIRYIPVLRRK